MTWLSLIQQALHQARCQIRESIFGTRRVELKDAWTVCPRCKSLTQIVWWKYQTQWICDECYHST